MVTPLDDARIATDQENGTVGLGYYYDEYAIVEGSHEVAYALSLDAALYASHHIMEEERNYHLLGRKFNILAPDGSLAATVRYILSDPIFVTTKVAR